MGSGANGNFEARKNGNGNVGSISLSNATITVPLEDLVAAIATTTARLISGEHVERTKNPVTTNCFLDNLRNLQNGDNSSLCSCSVCGATNKVNLSEIVDEDVLQASVSSFIPPGFLKQEDVKLRSFMSEYNQLTTALENFKDTMKKFYLETKNSYDEISTMKLELATLRNENRQLKNEVGIKESQIQLNEEVRQNQRTKIESMRRIMEMERLTFQQYETKFINETRKNHLEHQQVMSNYEVKASQMMTVILSLKENQKQNLDEIAALKEKLEVEQQAAEERTNLAKTNSKQLKVSNVEKNAALKETAIEEEIPKKLELITEEEKQQQQQQPLPFNTIKDDPFRAEATVTYTIQNIDQLKSEHLSPPFYVHMLPWKIMVRPENGFFACYLYCNDADKSTTWYCNAVYILSLKCHKPNGQPKRQRTSSHLYNAKECSWGLQKFIELEELLNPENGFSQDNSITITINLKAESPEGVVTGRFSPA